MDRELTTAGFEELINLRIHMASLQSQGVVYKKNKISDIKLKYTVAANKIPSEYGYIRAKTLQGLIDSTARKGKTVYSGLKRKEIYARRNQSQGNGRS